ncbi:MAG: tRNA pseudouridine(38-40) synthase TruA, partial [Methanobacterium sp.]|nr:tRNA pseudouridine(38-40) synthase TruA [Methanobacterium sp.]
RNIKEINIKQNGHLIVIDVIGESFLWNMVRKIVTIITIIGKKEMEYKEIDCLLDPDIYIPITPAPAEGLILMDVKYHNIKFTYDKYAKNNFYKTLKDEYIHRSTIAAAEKEMMNTLKNL